MMTRSSAAIQRFSEAVESALPRPIEVSEMARPRAANQRSLPVPRIGCDLAEVAAVVDSVAHFGDRYLDRVYSATERQQTADQPERLAARFAGKEAVLKVLRETSGIGYREIEILSDATGAPSVRLDGLAAVVAEHQRLGPISISLSHERGLALATAIALSEQGQQD